MKKQGQKRQRKFYKQWAGLSAALLLLVSAIGCGPQKNVSEIWPGSAAAENISSGPGKEDEGKMTPEEWKTVLNQPLNKTHYKGDYFLPTFGLCEDYPLGTSAQTVEQDFALLHRYGIRRLRISIAWGDYEPQKGVHDWTFLDQIVSLAEQYELDLSPYICYSPPWATGSDWKGNVKDLRDWYDFVYTLASRYKGRIHQWEIWNEGDNADFWGGTWLEQLELVKTGAQAVKAADPEAKTIFSGLTDTGRAHVQSIYTAGVGDYIDIIDVHGYNETWNSNSTESYAYTISDLAGTIKTNGGKQELWVGEIGYSDYVQENGQVSYYVKKNEDYEKTQPFQAVTFLRTYATIVSTNEVSGIMWYEIKNLRLDSEAIGDVNNYFLGCLDHNYFPKPLWFAVTMANQLFSSPYRPIDDRIVLDTQDDVYIHAFEKEDGNVILAAWKRGSVPGTATVTLPAAFQQAVRYSPTGEKSLFPVSSAPNSTTIELTLEPDSLVLLELFAAQTPARVTMEKPLLVKTGDGNAEIRATIRNLGSETSADFEAELFLDPECSWDCESVILPVKGLAPGEETTAVWTVTRGEGDVPLNAWCVAHTADTPLAASAIQG